jgi:hypothetical protein
MTTTAWSAASARPSASPISPPPTTIMRIFAERQLLAGHRPSEGLGPRRTCGIHAAPRSIDMLAASFDAHVTVARVRAALRTRTNGTAHAQ